MVPQNLSTGLTGRLEQQTALSLNQQRSLELLALPVTDLDIRLQEELQSNPMLEVEEFPSAEITAAGNEVSPPENFDENDYEQNSVLSESWADDLPLPCERDASDDRRDFFNQLSAPPPALKSSLLEELSVLSLPEEIFRAALEIIGSLNDDGYLTTALADLAMVAMVDMSDMETALDIVQKIAPPGAAARDLPECLKLQLERSGRMTPQLKKLLTCGIEDLEKNRLDQLAGKLQISMPELESMLKTLRSLNPAPGKSGNSAGVIIPDLVIDRDGNGNYRVTPRRSRNMRITISPVYEKLRDDASLSAQERQYFTEKLAGARELLNALERRQNTLVRLGELLIRHQKEFLDNGKEFLKPLTMKSAAAELEVNESTVSRAVDGKYAETPQGILPLKFFFSSGYNTADGDDVSGMAVREKIRQIIAAEDSSRPYSDEAIAGMLKDQGVPVARRTVAKYREAMGIESSSLRKKYF